MKRSPSHSAGPTPEQWQAFLENKLSPAERARVEAMLQGSEDDRNALEGLRALGPEGAATLVADLHKDIDIMTSPDRDKRRGGVVRRLGYVRMGVAAAVLVLFGAGFWMLSVLQEPKTDRQAFDRHFEPIEPQQLGNKDGQTGGRTEGLTESGAFTEQLASDQASPSPGQLQYPATSNAVPAYPVPPSLFFELKKNGAVTEDFNNLENADVTFDNSAGSDLGFNSRPTADGSRATESDNLQFFSRADNSEPAMEEKVDRDAAVARPQVSSQAAQKNLVLKDSRKQENPVSIRGSRSEKRTEGSSGAAGQGPASVPTTSDYREMNEQKLPLADDPSTETGTDGQISLSEVTVTNSSNRGYSPAPDPYEQGQTAYTKGDYRMATEWLIKVPVEHPQAQAADLLEANAWLERDKPDKAIPLLQGLKALGPGPLYDQCRWYLALAHIAQGDEDPAMILLEALILENGPYRARALELLSELSD